MGKWKSKTSYPFVAHAGKDQIVYARYHGTATVTLNASGSNCTRSNSLTYTWYLDGSSIAMGMHPTIKLIPGEHTITLVVSNARDESESSQVCIRVVDSLEVECKIFPPDMVLFKKKPEIMAKLYLPEDIPVDQVDMEQPFRLHPGGAEVIHHYTMQWRRHKKRSVNIFAFFKTDVLDRLAPNGIAELAVSGRLKSGRYFFGRDTIKIEDTNMKTIPRRKHSQV
jgi:hypothetical protein